LSNLNNKALGMLGLAMRAGKVVSGEFSCENAIKQGKAFLVILAEDASDNTKKKFTDMTNYRNIPLVIYGNKLSLGKATGKEFRASVAIIDQAFAENILKLI